MQCYPSRTRQVASESRPCSIAKPGIFNNGATLGPHHGKFKINMCESFTGKPKPSPANSGTSLLRWIPIQKKALGAGIRGYLHLQ